MGIVTAGCGTATPHAEVADHPRPHVVHDEGDTVVAAYLTRLERWIDCLKANGVRVSGPYADLDVSVNPDPALTEERDACEPVRPTVSNALEIARQSGAGPDLAQPVEQRWGRSSLLNR